MSRPLGVMGVSALALMMAACGGSEEPAPDATPTETPTSEASETATPEATETMEVSGLDAAIAGEWRSEDAKARDAFRNPKETLEFFEIEPTDTVAEIWPGGGWYASILAPYLKDEGTYIAVGFDADSSDYAARASENFQTNFVDQPDIYGDIVVAELSPETGPIAEENSIDTILTFRNVHNWMSGGYTEKVFADMYAALKPGGILGVVEHRLPSGSEQDPSASSGYVHEDFVKQLASEAGFVFVADSDINANPADTADHPFGVWTLPPTSRTTDRDGNMPEGFDAAKYEAIGESDRMTLKFRKPTAEEIAAAEAETASEEAEEE